jgi:hypothetical protein
MRTVNFRDQVMNVVARKMGYDPTIDFSTDQAIAYATYVNLWVKKLYPLFDWPEWTLIEQRTPNPAHYIDFAQVGQSVIGRVLKVYLRDPQADRGVFDTPFKLSASGVFCGFEHGSSVWLKYIKPAPQYTAVAWTSAATFNLGDLTFDPTAGSAGGSVYASAQATNTNHPVTDPAWWTLVPFPEQIAIMVIRGAYAEALREEGQTDKANAEEQIAFQEAQAAAGIHVHSSYDAATDQARVPPRYHSPIPAGAGK